MADEVVVPLRLEDDDFTEDLKDAGENLKDFAEESAEANFQLVRSFTDLKEIAGTVLGGLGKVKDIFVAGAQAVLEQARALGVHAAELANFASQLDLGVERLQEFAAVTVEDGVAVDVLADGLRTLAERITESAVEKAGEGHEALQQLGITAVTTSGRIKTTEEVFLEVADAFEKGENQAFLTTKALQLFGDVAGGNLVASLRRGSSELVTLAEEARNAGKIMSEEDVEAAKDMGSAIEGLDRDISALVRDALKPFVGDIKDGAVALREFVQEARPVATFLAREFRVAIIQAGNALESFLGFLPESVAGIAALQAVPGALLLSQLAEAKVDFKRGLKDFQEFRKRALLELKDEEEDPFFTAEEEAVIAALGPTTGGTPIPGGGAAGTAAQDQIKRQKDLLQKLNDENEIARQDDFGKLQILKERELAFLEGVEGAEAAIEEKFARLSQALREQQAKDAEDEEQRGIRKLEREERDAERRETIAVRDAERSLEASLREVEREARELELAEREEQRRNERAERIILSQSDELTQFDAHLAEMLTALEGFEGAREQVERKGSVKRQQLVAKQRADNLRQTASTFGQLVTITEVFGKKQNDASRAFRTVQAIINTHAAITEALASSPPPANIIAAAAVAATGFAQVKAIKSGGEGGGGGISLGGGGAGATPTAPQIEAPGIGTLAPEEVEQPEAGLNVSITVQGDALDKDELALVIGEAIAEHRSDRRLPPEVTVEA